MPRHIMLSTLVAVALGLSSPNGQVSFELARSPSGGLVYTVRLGHDIVVEPSAVGIAVDGTNLGDGVEISRAQTYAIDERYPWYGVHATAVNRCRGSRVALMHVTSKTAWTLDARACDDGVAFRYLVPGAAAAVRTPDEATTFRWPAGAVIDFFDSEAKEMVDRYQSILRESAERHIMVNFHRANKPTGEARTWPHELTREGVYGLEHRQAVAWAAHNTTLPFTRFLAGAADYTPVVFGDRRKETSWAHQIATAVVFTSPVLVFGGHPRSLLDNPAVEMIKSLPSTWDETIVLQASEIGEIAAFARRRGTTWFVAALNGPNARTLQIDLGFLGKGRYDALVVRDKPDDPAAVAVEKTRAAAATPLTVEPRAAGGFIARLTPTND